MIRKTFFWLHLVIGVAAGLFIFIMAATGVMLAFEKQITGLIDRNVRLVSVVNDARPQPLNHLLEAVRRAGLGDPTAIVISNQPQAATQFTIGRNKSLYVDPYSGAVLGASSEAAHAFFANVERFHRALGAPLGSRSVGHWLAAVSNLLFAVLIPLGVILWLPRKWTWKATRNSIAFRSGLGGKAREWNWHNVLGIWCAVPLLIIALSGVVMSFSWANALLFRLTGSPLPVSRLGAEIRRPHGREPESTTEPNYEHLFTAAKALNPKWRTITLNIARDANAPVSATIDTGTGGQPQARTQYLLNPATWAIVQTRTFADGSLGQRLRAFVRFGHTGEYYGYPGQAVAAIASLAACLLAYTGLTLATRRFLARFKKMRRNTLSTRKSFERQPVA